MQTLSIGTSAGEQHDEPADVRLETDDGGGVTVRHSHGPAFGVPDVLQLLGDDSHLEDPDERRVSAGLEALERLGIVGLSSRYVAFMRVHGNWMMSRASGVAIILLAPADHALLLSIQTRENANREFMTERVCRVVAGTMIDAFYICVDRQHEHASREHRHAACMDSFPGYTTIRNWLAFDCDANYTLACKVAFEHAARSAALDRHSYGGERGWL